MVSEAGLRMRGIWIAAVCFTCRSVWGMLDSRRESCEVWSLLVLGSNRVDEAGVSCGVWFGMRKWSVGVSVGK